MNMLVPKLKTEVDTARLPRVGLSTTILTPALSSCQKFRSTTHGGGRSRFPIEQIMIAATSVPRASTTTDNGPKSWYRPPAIVGPATVEAEELVSSFEFPSTRSSRRIRVGR